MAKPLVIILFLSTLAFTAGAQKNKAGSLGIGLKAGYNFAKVAGSSSVNTANTSGFHIGGFYSPGGNKSKGFGYRTEIIYSKQGYDFVKANTTGSVKLDYILLPQLTTFSITKFVQLQLGAQIAFLINAKADSAVNNGSSNPYNKVADYYNKFDYGFAGGVEVHPIKGLLIGARLNISLANTNKEQSVSIGLPAYIPNASGADLKNNVLQIFAGWKF
ncbi:MAG: PorT family protein [Rhizobacter sp.]|nr:PorT family protein [Ferruginibacter sp.]